MPNFIPYIWRNKRIFSKLQVEIDNRRSVEYYNGNRTNLRKFIKIRKEHKIYYKYEGNTPEYIKKELKECADLVTFLDSKMLAINEEVRSIREENKE